MRSDDELLAAWRDGDRAAGDELFQRHFHGVYRFFCRKVSDDAAEDLTQRSFEACIAGRERFRGDSSFRTYLFGTARNLLLRHFRDNSRRPDLDLGVTSLHDLGPGPATLFAARHEQRLLLEALRRIPLELQLLLELHYWEGMRGPELSQVLNIPEGTVRSRLRRARDRLTAALEELADSEDLLAATLTDLDGWAASLAALVSGV